MEPEAELEAGEIPTVELAPDELTVTGAVPEIVPTGVGDE
jgi:hypothetical protein